MNHDERLDKLLGELGTKKAGSGFQARMLQGLEERQAARGPQQAKRWFAVPMIAAAGALLVAGVALHQQTRSAVMPPPATVVQPAEAAAGQVPLVAKAEGPSAVRTAAFRRASRREAREPHAVQAVESFPAPIAPMTEQEKLLRNCALKRDPQQRAALNAEARARAEAARTQEYEAFFATPPPSADVLETIKRQKKLGEKQ